jgi:membrane protein DedA with SNARE-associated domain
MRFMLLATLLLAANELGHVEAWMQQAFYPALLAILLIASLGIPIPEDVPLIAAGVLLRTHPGIASWPGTFVVALVGIMIGDLVLYTLGRRWGPGVMNHRSVRWVVTPDHFARITRRFQVHGTLFCFFGRFLMGVRAAMCVAAGATGFPYWRFFLADFAGALLSVPLFVILGYWFAGMIPTLRAYVGGVQAVILLLAAAACIVVYVVYRKRKRRHATERSGWASSSAGHGPSAATTEKDAGPAAKSRAAAAKSEFSPGS